jgi:CTP:molybdopterin cytidylyltransferase MocA
LETAAVVVLAAGEGRRFGGVKQLHPVSGRPMLELVLDAAASSGVECRLVVLGAHAEAILAEVELHGARPVTSDRWSDGQAASLIAGLSALPDEVTEAAVVLGDGPGLSPEAIRRVLAAGGGVRAADYGAGRSHPVVLPRSVWRDLPSSGETPGRTLPATLVDCSDLPPPGDVDTPQATGQNPNP